MFQLSNDQEMGQGSCILHAKARDLCSGVHRLFGSRVQMRLISCTGSHSSLECHSRPRAALIMPTSK